MGIGSWLQENVVDPIAAYNPITMATDIVTGGAMSEALGVGDIGVVGQVSEAAGQLGEAATETYHDISGQTAAEAAEQASTTQAAMMQQQLDYLKEINKLPQQYKEEALIKLAKISGLGGTHAQQVQQQSMIDQAKQSPLYQSLMSGRGAGEEAVMRHAAATGGLRSGDTQSALYDYNVRLEQDALTKAYGQQMGGLQGLAGLPTGEQGISNVMGNIGNVQAQGILGQAQAQQMGTQNVLNTLLGVGGLVSKFI